MIETIIGLCIGMKFGKALKSGLFVGVGFVGLGVVTALLTTNFNAPLKAISDIYHLQLNVFDNYTYTLETIIQAKAKGLILKCVPIRVNPDLRKSKLVRNMFDYIRRSMFTMIRMFIIYRPFRFFAILASMFFLVGALIGLRFLYYFVFYIQ